MHVYKMLHFTAGGAGTKSPEELGALHKVKVLITGINMPRPKNNKTPADFGLNYDSGFLLLENNLKIEYWDVPVDDPVGMVLLFHGHAASKQALLPECAAFHEAGYAVFMIDFRGSGGSSGNYTTIGLRETAEVDVAFNYVKETRKNIPIILYGRSMGSAAILRALHTTGIKPDAVILENPFDSLLHTVSNRFRMMGLPAFPSNYLMVFWGSLQMGGWGFSHNPAEYAKSVSCPAMLLHGEKDPRVRLSEAKTVFENLSEPKRLVVFKDIGHKPFLAKYPDQWKEEVFSFLDEYLSEEN